MVKRLLHYVQGMLDQGIVLSKTGGTGLQLTVFSDADMAGDIDGRRSTSGLLVFLESVPISWLSLKQKVVALSTCEAEYVVTATVACQAMWLRRLLGELTGVEAHPPHSWWTTSLPSPSRRIRFSMTGASTSTSSSTSSGTVSMEGRSSSSSSKLVGSSRTSSPSRSAVFGSRS